MSDELNPNHPVTRHAREQWHKLCALVVSKYCRGRAEITGEEIEAWLKRDGERNIVVHYHKDSIELKIVDDAEARRLLNTEGGLTHDGN